MNVPEEYGGGGMGITELAIVLEELAANGCPLLLLVVSPAICATIIARFGSDAQKQRGCRGFGSGELKMAFAITEPDAGSNSHKHRHHGRRATATSGGCKGRSTTSRAPTSPRPCWS